MTCRHGSSAERRMEVLKLRVKYCGGCNPDIDRGAVVERLRKLTADACQEVEWSGDDPDVIVLVNGCPHACLEQDNFPVDRRTMCISVQGTHVDREPVPEGQLHEVIWERLRKWLTAALLNGPQE